MPHTLYVLELKGRKYYVGTTGQRLRQRVDQHKRGAGSAWTRKHSVVKVLSSHEVSEASAGFQEDAEVQRMMAEHGIAAVRGGTYSRVVLPPKQVKELRSKIWHNQSRCTRCGHNSHFRDKCFARTTVDGERLSDDEEDASSSEGDDEPFCTRCGHTGHTSRTCYARTGIDGCRL